MAKAKTKTSAKTRKTKVPVETNGLFFLKLVLYVVLGAQWVFLTDTAMTHQVPLPVGLIVGLLFTQHEHFQIDRKIEYALLLIVCFVGYFAQTGIVVSVLK